jgi:hypothetical protein
MTRKCGDCQLCCRLLPTHEINKPALAKCPHQKHGKGCAIYARRPVSCQLWSCRWLVGNDTQELPRPDRAHYVIDLIPDFITYTEEGKSPAYIEVVQVWVDPAYPLAHREPALRRWLEQQNKPAIVRYSSADGFVLFPPALTGGRWVEHQSSMSEHEHTLEEKAAALGGTLQVEVDDGPGTPVYRTTLKVGDEDYAIGTVQATDPEASLARAREMAANRAQQIERMKDQIK